MKLAILSVIQVMVEDGWLIMISAT